MEDYVQEPEVTEAWTAVLHNPQLEMDAEVLIKSALPQMVKVILETALDDDESKRLRTDCAKYIIERGLGKIKDQDTSKDNEIWKNALDKLKAVN